MQAKLYAPNYEQRRQETYLRASGRCENTLPSGERCPVKIGDIRITRSHNLQFEALIIHHTNGDPENPDAEMLAICWACHMRLHRKPGPGRRKASARKQGYEVVRIPHLLELLTASGFRTWKTDQGLLGWQIGNISGQATDGIDAIATALHWMDREICYLQDKLEQSTIDTTLTPEEHDLILRRRDAERRRACDRALREAPGRHPVIAPDTTKLLNAALIEEESSKAEVLAYA